MGRQLTSLGTGVLLLLASSWPGAAQSSLSTTAFAQVIQFVSSEGWLANLGRMCAELGIASRGDQCVFRQISVEETQGRGDPHGFNVPAEESAPAQVLIFHLAPLVGEFFIVSSEGELLKAFIRRKGAGYESIPLETVQEEFAKDRAYWLENLDRLKRGLSASRSPSK